MKASLPLCLKWTNAVKKMPPFLCTVDVNYIRDMVL